MQEDNIGEYTLQNQVYKMEERVQIDVGGTLFRIKKETLQRYPDTLLGSITHSSEFSKGDNSLYFDRNPELFNTILDYYRNGQVHLPSNICAWVWKSELEFWKIPQTKVSDCCFSIFSKYDERKTSLDYLRAAFHVPEMPLFNTLSSAGKLRHQLWMFLDEPSSSKCARVFSIVYLSIVIVSATLPCLMTHPNVRVEVWNATTLAWYSYVYDIDMWINFNNQKEVMFATTEIPFWLNCLDLVITIFFTVEIFSRFLACPSKCRYFMEWLNIIDIILLIGMWIHFIILKYHEEKLLKNLRLTYFFCFTESLSVFRLIRFFRVAKQYSSLRILYLALKSSLKELILLLLTFIILGWVFANLMYYAEIRESETFPNMLVGMWWAVVTMTTVGYGDMYPMGPLGRFVGSICAMCGLLVLAMPIAVIAGNFNDLYKTNEERETFNKLHDMNESTNKESNIANSTVEPFPLKSIDCKEMKLKNAKDVK